ncbi:LPXTG cell wall anchor domain-containing protein [Microbacterium sp. 179-I 1D1 NHS]|uniref:LPXTG cell wall anchor domain-containing protein n=1 Tax=Microbacterium sp. 179-I 1D1 NHS TaxID=3374298 RepID=UPI00387A0861
MWGNIWRAAIAVAVIAGAGSTSAYAADGSYVPSSPPEDGLAGSVVQALCVDEAPTIGYSIVRVAATASAGGLSTGPVTMSTALAALSTARSAVATSSPTAELVIRGDGQEIAVSLRVDASGEGSGSILWPGVEVAGDGTVEALPGWVRSGDGWEPRNDAAAWTTGDVTAQLRVGDESIDVPLAYPGYSDDCATPVGVASGGVSGGLPQTGGQWPVAAAVGGTAAVVAGAVLVSRRRRRAES